MYGAHGEQRRYGSVVGVDVAVGENDVVVAIVDAALSLLAQVVERLAQTVLALAALEYYRQLHGVEALVSDVAQDVELRVCQYGVGQTHHLAVGLVGCQDACSHATDIFAQRHHEVLPYRVDGRVRDLSKLLAEIVEEDLWLVREHRQRCVVTHRRCGLLSLCRHGHDCSVHVLFAETELNLVAYEVGHAVVDLASRVELLQLYAVCRQPLAVGVSLCQAVFNLAVIIDFSFLCVDEQNFSRLQTSLLGNLGRVKIHHAHLRCHHHGVVLRYAVACRA